MHDYSWPGNVRELKRICEQLAVTSPLPIIRGEDVLRIIKPSLDTGDAAPVDFSLGLEKIVSNYEAIVLTQALNKINDVDEVARTLQVSRSNLYKKIKDYGIEWSKQ